MNSQNGTARAIRKIQKIAKRQPGGRLWNSDESGVHLAYETGSREVLVTPEGDGAVRVKTAIQDQSGHWTDPDAVTYQSVTAALHLIRAHLAGDTQPEQID